MVERKYTPLERSFLAFESLRTPQCVGCVFVIHGEPDKARLEGALARASLQFPRLGLVIGKRGWKRGEVSYQIPTEKVQEGELSSLVGAISHETFSRHEQPWRVKLLHTSNDEWLLSIHWHHAWCDGMGGAALLTLLCEQAFPERKKASRERSKSSFLQQLLALKALLQQNRVLKGAKTPYRDHAQEEKRRVFSLQIPCSLVEQLRKEYRLTAHECFLSLLATGLSADSALGSSLGVIVPVSLRRAIAEAPLENCILASSLHLSLLPEFSQSAERVKSEMKRVKSTSTLAQYEAGIDLLGKLPLSIQRILWKQALAPHSCICTSLGMLPSELQVGGKKVTQVFALPAPIFRQPFAFSWLQYEENYSLTAVVYESKKEVIRRLFTFIEDGFFSTFH